jgi:5-methylcytosine-specific restriction endonuclease McrA
MPRSVEETREAKRLHMARKRAADPEAARRYHRERHHKNRERNLAKMRAYYGRRFFWGRAMKLRGEGRATTANLAYLWKRQRGRCALTGRRLNRENSHLDHITARARGGADNISNLRYRPQGGRMNLLHIISHIAARHLSKRGQLRAMPQAAPALAFGRAAARLAGFATSIRIARSFA